ncbi:MAG: J domain-containing protein, partial [Vibrionaceae bacterium]
SRATLKICQLVNRELAQLLASQPPAPASTPLPRRLAVETGIRPQAPLRPAQSMEYLPPPQNVEAEVETTPAADISAPSRRASGASASAAALENASTAEMSLANSERADSATNAAPKKAGKLRRIYAAIFKKNEIEKTREQKIIEKCRQKLNKAFQPKGALAELKQKTFAIYATGCDAEAKASFTKMLSDSEKLLGKLNTHISIILLERNGEFIEQIRTAFAIVLNAKFLHGKILPRQQPLALRPLFMGSFYYQSICSYLQNCPPPWDLHTLEQKITLLFNHLKSGATDSSYQPQELSIENFTLIDVPLAPDIELSKNYCLKALGLGLHATDQEIQSAYTSLCLQCHPDKDPDNPEQAMARFLRLQVLFFQLKLDELMP